MGQHAALGRHLQPRDDAVEQPQQFADHLGIVARRVDADTGVARSEQEAVEDGGGNAFDVVKGVIGLQAHAHPPGEADGVAKAGRHLAFFCYQNQILIAHQF